MEVPNPGCAQLQRLPVRLRFDLGKDYVKVAPGWTSSQIRVSLVINGNPVADQELIITPDKPEAWAIVLIPNPSAWGATVTIDGSIPVFNVVGGNPPHTHRMEAECLPEYDYQFATNQPYITGGSLAATPVDVNTTTFEYNFSWNSDCAPIQSYQLQILRRATASGATEYDWNNKATTFDVSATGTTCNYIATLAEGMGSYYWRVRPVATKAGGMLDPTRAGAWAYAPVLTVASTPDGNRNWIYSRTFTEGGRVAEKLTYANGLQQIQQSQTRLAGEAATNTLMQQKVVATQTVQDYVGRDAVHSLPVPMPATDNKLGYRANLLTPQNTTTQPYGPQDFDEGTGLAEPAPARAGNYYSSTSTGDNQRVPDAEGYPFARTLFFNDGSGRVKEQGGVGAQLRVRPTPTPPPSSSTQATAPPPRTVRTHYADVAPSELNRLFGKEAPRAEGTFKIITTDPNNTSTVTYQTKEGQTIATALARGEAPRAGADSTLTRPLASAAASDFQVVEDVRGTGPLIGKTLVITQACNLNVHYEITPAVLRNDCIAFCATCDYKVRITVTKLDPTAGYQVLTPEERVVQGRYLCTAAKTTIDQNFPLREAGIYRIQRSIVALTPAASNPEITELDNSLAMIRANVQNLTRTAIWERINRFLAINDVAGLYNMLWGEGYTVLTDPDGSQYFRIPVDDQCKGDIQIPYWDDFCGAPCEPSALDFEKELDDKLTALNAQYQISYGFSDVLPGFNPGDFNKLVQNMLQHELDYPEAKNDYTCAKLRSCWDRQLLLLESSMYSAGSTPTAYHYNLAKEFLACTGVDMREPIEAPNSVDPAKSFKQFQIDLSNLATQSCLLDMVRCEVSYINADELENLGNDQQELRQRTIDRFNEYSKKCRNGLYICLTTPPPTDYSSNLSFDIRAEADKAAAELRRMCRSACEDRRGEFLTRIVDQLHRINVYVPSDNYAVTLGDANQLVILNEPVPSSATRIDQCQLDILVQELVQRCQEDCKLDVIDAGNGKFTVGDETQYEHVQQAMLYDFNLGISEEVDRCNEFEPVKKLGNRLERAELTTCATEVLGYVGALLRGVPHIRNAPGRSSARGCSGLPGAVGEAVLDVFSVNGVLSSNCSQNAPNCLSSSTDPTNQVTVVDYRDNNMTGVLSSNSGTPILGSASGTQFNYQSDFLLVWNADTDRMLHTCLQPAYGRVPSAYGPCYETCDASADGLYYVLRFQNGINPINKEDIQEIGAVFLDDQAPVSSMTAVYESTHVKVRLLMNDGTTVVADVFVDMFDPQNGGRVADYQFLQWKNYQQCGVDANKWQLCFEWKKTLPAIDPTTTVQDNGEPEDCNLTAANRIRDAISNQLGTREDRDVANYRAQYQNKCVLMDGAQEQFTLTYDVGYHHFTLYYYDRAGNLIKTVPPAGVEILPSAQANLPRSQRPLPPHRMATTYTYNSLRQLVEQTTPDGGTTRFWYNNKGMLRFSQNARQQANDRYSYTKYDKLGRIVEVGESTQLPGTGGVIAVPTPGDIPLDMMLTVSTQVNIPDFPSLGCVQVTRTVYSERFPGLLYDSGILFNAYTNAPQHHLTNRVSYSYLDEDGNPATTADNSYTYYSYDPHGNVEWLAQEQADLNRKYIRYEYDLISNKVLRVNFQEGQLDQFYHRYAYDGDNRLTQVFTSADGVVWDQDARYQYYPHGPLKRLELGEDGVQGIDYTYTLQGWLKAVNNPTIGLENDPGGDGAKAQSAATVNDRARVAADAFQMTLGYFDGDYKTNNASSLVFNGDQVLSPAPAKSLYNGNISTWTTNTGTQYASIPNNNQNVGLSAEAYRYDELNRLVGSQMYMPGGRGTISLMETEDYRTVYRYDPNGNLLGLSRHGSAALDQGQNLRMDRLAYTYPEDDVSHKIIGNRLLRVNDDIPNNSLYDDFKQYTGTTSQDNQYKYDEIGNLVKDVTSGVKEIEWTVYGKIHSIIRSNGGSTVFRYDAAGNRIAKLTYSPSNDCVATYYARDAQGNIMAVYEQTVTDGTSSKVALLEQTLFGSSRLGQRQHRIELTGLLPSPAYYSRTVGEKRYELSDHLGNVRALITDEKLAERDASGFALGFRPNMVAYYNYYPFGQMQPGRYAPGTPTLANGYRYGFNGKEMDNNGELGLTNYDYGFRIYNPAIAKFLSVDPLTKSYPMLTPYQFASNSPISGIDLDGKEFDWFMVEQAEKHLLGTTVLEQTREGFIARGEKIVSETVHGLMNEWDYMTGKKLATIDPGIAQKQLMDDIRKDLYIVPGSIVIVKGYVDLAINVVRGNPRAYGAAILEAGLFFLPLDEIRFGKFGPQAPHGFVSWEHFRAWGTNVEANLAKAGHHDVDLYMQGSSVTGKSAETGAPFDQGRESDFDLAISSESLFEKAEQLGLTDGNRTGPIKPGSVEASLLGLDEMLANAAKMAGRKVEVMIFRLGESVKQKGPSVWVPTQRKVPPIRKK